MIDSDPSNGLDARRNTRKRHASICIGAITILFFIHMLIQSQQAGSLLWPHKDALEYASMAYWMAEGEGPFLRIGPAWFPARVPPAVSWLLLPHAWISGGFFQSFYLTIFGCALLTLLCFRTLMRKTGFDEGSGIASMALLASSPLFARYSGWVMSEVPTMLALTLMLLSAIKLEGRSIEAYGAAFSFGLCGGLMTGMRQTNIVWFGVIAALLLARHHRSMIKHPATLLLIVAGFALPVVALLIHQWRYLGHPLRSGYDYWTPNFLGADGIAFNGIYAFNNAELERSGNIAFYLKELFGLKRALYAWPILLPACVGVANLYRHRNENPAWRLIVFPSMASLIMLFLLFSVFYWRDDRFLITALAPVCCCAAAGLAAMNRFIEEKWRFNRWTLPLLTMAICALNVFPLPQKREYAQRWRIAQQAERKRMQEQLLSSGDIERPIVETSLPLPLAAMMLPRNAVAMPNGANPEQVHFFVQHLQNYPVSPLRLDNNCEDLWSRILETKYLDQR